MIAILHKQGVIASFIDQVTFIAGDTIEAVGGGAKGINHDVLIINEGAIRYEQAKLVLVTSKGEFETGGTINPTLFTDARHLLPKTKEQQLQQQVDDLTLMMADILANGGAV